MKTLAYNVYSFPELSPKAQSLALEDARAFLSETWDADPTIDDAKQCLTFAGFNVEQVHYSGFSCQGDGACFTGAWAASKVNPAAMRDYAPQDSTLHAIADGLAKLAALYPDAAFSVKHSGRYYHEYCTEFDITLSGTREISGPELEDTEKQLIELARDAMRWVYRQIEKDYSWSLEDEQVRDFITANEYDFLESGKMAPRKL